MRNEHLLLGRRDGTGYEDGKLHLPSGHLEAGESVVHAACREAREELGIEVEPHHLELVHVMHRHAGGGRLAAFFRLHSWRGEIRNAEPHKCAELTWVPIDDLPGDTVPYARTALRALRAGNPLSLDGWAR